MAINEGSPSIIDPMGKGQPAAVAPIFKALGSPRNEPAFFRIDGLEEQIFGANEQVRGHGPSD